MDVSGGYHDAGDHAKFGLPQAYSATVLGLAHMEFAEAFADTATEAHYKRIMDRFVDYSRDAQSLEAMVRFRLSVIRSVMEM